MSKPEKIDVSYEGMPNDEIDGALASALKRIGYPEHEDGFFFDNPPVRDIQFYRAGVLGQGDGNGVINAAPLLPMPDMVTITYKGEPGEMLATLASFLKYFGYDQRRPGVFMRRK